MTRSDLERLILSHTWTWEPALRRSLDELLGSSDQHPIVAARSVTDRQIAELDADTIAILSSGLDHVESLQTNTGTPTIAYFSPEFGISELIPQYSGGLGILAGDHLKASSDHGLGLAGVGLMYRRGFFRQGIVKNKQTERYDTYEPEDLGMVDTGIVVEVPITARIVEAKVWRMDVGSVPVLLLDTDRESNTEADRLITDSLYSGDRLHRIEQEMVLGVGGARALAAMGWTPDVHHLNEGHAGFLILELLDREIANGASLDEALDNIAPGLVFTTHTPVPAGIDIFEAKLAQAHLQPWARRWDVPLESLMNLGADPAPSTDAPKDGFNMAVFCLEAASLANGVSKLHGEVSRELFAAVPSGSAIGSITNGVHARTWTAPHLQDIFDEQVGAGWADGDELAWKQLGTLSDEITREARRTGTTALCEMVVERTGTQLDPDALTIGFARRFATYKRATLVLQHRNNIEDLLADDDRPLQFVFAGKAHPADAEGKALLSEIVKFSKSKAANRRFVFVEDYDIDIARAMYAGADVWLNTPIRPHEASGTSGEKSALNGGLNCSISDGWWDEMADEWNGWTIPDAVSEIDATRDRLESAAIIDIIENQIVPTYYEDGTALSTAWLDRVRHCWQSLGPRVTAARMIRDYEAQLYQPAQQAAKDR